MLDVYLVWPKSSFTFCSNVQGISDHCRVQLEVEWGQNCLEHQVERLAPVYHKTNIPFLQSVPQNEGNCWSDFYRYVKRQKGNREIIPVIKDHNATITTDSTGKDNILNSYYASVFCCNLNILKIQLANSDETFIINTKIVRKRLAKFGRNKSVGPDGVPGEILKLGGEAMTPFLARLLEISLNNATIPSD